MVVIDASALVALLLEGPSGPIQDRLREQTLAAPYLVDLEVASALRRRVRRGVLSPAEAGVRVATLAALPVERHAHTRLLPRIWDMRDNISTYDAAYVALAETLGLPLLTADRRLARAPGVRCAVEILPV